MGSSIGRRVRAYRGGMSAEELASLIGGERITRSVIANIESGRKKDLSVTELVEIALALGVPIAALIADVTRPYDEPDLPDASPSLRALTNSELLVDVLSTDGGTDYVDHSNVRAVLRGLRSLRLSDSEIDECRSSLDALRSDLNDSELVGYKREAVLDDIDAYEQALNRALDQRSTVLDLLRALGVHVDAD